MRKFVFYELHFINNNVLYKMHIVYCIMYNIYIYIGDTVYVFNF